MYTAEPERFIFAPVEETLVQLVLAFPADTESLQNAVG